MRVWTDRRCQAACSGSAGARPAPAGTAPAHAASPATPCAPCPPARCPAFKLLTYYGGIKERAAKRQGWSKPNAFHVCITSYTLVLQVGGVV